MTRLSLVLTLFAAGFLTAPASAEEPVVSKPRVTVVATAAFGYVYVPESETFLSPSLVQGFGVTVPLGSGWSYYAELAGATGFSALQPALQVITGPTKKLSDHLVIGGTCAYKLQPLYDDVSPPMHIVGCAVAPIFPTSFGSVGFPIGGGHNLTTGDTFVLINFKTAIRLW